MEKSKYRYNQKAGALNEASSHSRLVSSPELAHFPGTQALPPSAMQQDGVPQPLADETSGAAVVATQAFSRHMLHGAGAGGHVTQLAPRRQDRSAAGLDPVSSRNRWTSMFFYTVEEGQQVLCKRKDGTMEIIVGPRRIYRGKCRFDPMAHYVAHPGEFLIVRFRDGRQEHLPGPANLWFDPRIHLEIGKEDALQIAAKEAVVVYSEGEGGKISRRIVYGPEVFVPMPGEWLHTFSWHGSTGGHKGYQKVPNGLVFQKLWLMPDQMYHDVQDVRTADDAVLTIRLMMFFELCDIETMLGATHDPIGDFVNAATSDVVDFMGKHDFDSFKRHTEKLNEIASYRQLLVRAEQCGYRMHKIVYRGYGAPESLQRMHNEAIESRTKLQLERATEQQAQELEDFKLERHMHRAQRQRSEQEAQFRQQIDNERRQREAQLILEERQREFQRAQDRLDSEQRRKLAQVREQQEREHLDGLQKLGVDLTRLLTQGRADRVIEVRGARGQTHLHLSPEVHEDLPGPEPE